METPFFSGPSLHVMHYHALQYIPSLTQSLTSVLYLPDDLPRTETHRETVLQVIGDKSQKVEWPDHGFSLEVPDGALLPGVTANVTVKSILDGRFQLPKNNKLISALYSITTTKEFLKEVAVNIQHSAVITSEEEQSKFKFIISKSSQPYQFREMEGSFNPATNYGTIMLKEFSTLGGVGPASTEINCNSLTFYRTIPFTNVVDVHFVVIRKLDSLAEVCK